MIETPFKLGWLGAGVPDHRNFRFKAASYSADYPPANKLIWLTQILDQGTAGSCVANAGATCVEYARIQQKKLWAWSPSRLAIYYGIREMHGWEGVDSGAFITDCFKFINAVGTVPESEWPYNLQNLFVKPPKPVYDNASVNKSLLYRRVGQNLNDMKACICEGFPFVFGFSIFSNFNWNGVGVVPMPGPGDTPVGGHAVVCIGYDDATQCFDYQNSWGNNFGENGRSKIPYAYLLDPGLANDFWTVSLLV